MPLLVWRRSATRATRDSGDAGVATVDELRDELFGVHPLEPHVATSLKSSFLGLVKMKALQG